MSIQSFVDSAIMLYENDKYYEALCLTCIAIDACSAKIHSSETSNAKRYKQFLKSYFRTICEFGFPGISASSIRIKVNSAVEGLRLDDKGYVDMEQIIYHILRCGLVHNCKIEETIEFTEDTIIGDWEEDKFYIPKRIIWGLIAAVKSASDEQL